MDTIYNEKTIHGLGNDYLVLDPNKNDIKLQARNVEMLCRRNVGVGADGILYGPFQENGKLRVQIFKSGWFGSGTQWKWSKNFCKISVG